MPYAPGPTTELRDSVREKLTRWRAAPQIMVRELFGITPDAWQDDVLEEFPKHPRQAMQACKGPGKTAVLAWLGWNFLLTRPHPRIAALSVTAKNLRDNLWSEIASWQRQSSFLMERFEWTSERIFAKEHPATWWMSARACAQGADKSEQEHSLAGLHAPYVMVLLDESGAMPSGIIATAEAIFSSSTEAHIVQAGNPTHLEGPLFDASRNPERWKLYQITGDPEAPKRSPRVSIEWAREMIREYGPEHPYVLVNIFGRFPPSSLNTLIGPDEVEQAMKRHYREEQYAHEPKILGVDVARFGDDISVIFPRQGLVASKPTTLRNVDSIRGAGEVARIGRDWKRNLVDSGADGIMVDGTGGYGGGWCDQLRVLNYDPFEVQFAAEPHDRRYMNKRTEMMFDLVAWIRKGGSLPLVPDLVDELTKPQYWFLKDRMILEEKKLIKARIGRSPNYADALGLTFAEPVYKMPASPYPAADRAESAMAYNPVERDERLSGYAQDRRTDYNPWERQ